MNGVQLNNSWKNNTFESAASQAKHSGKTDMRASKRHTASAAWQLYELPTAPRLLGILKPEHIYPSLIVSMNLMMLFPIRYLAKHPQGNPTCFVCETGSHLSGGCLGSSNKGKCCFFHGNWRPSCCLGTPHFSSYYIQETQCKSQYTRESRHKTVN